MLIAVLWWSLFKGMNPVVRGEILPDPPSMPMHKSRDDLRRDQYYDLSVGSADSWIGFVKHTKV